MNLPESVLKRKESLIKNNIEVSVKDGAFGFDKISTVVISVPSEFKTLSAEEAPIAISYKNGNITLASCELLTDGRSDNYVSINDADGTQKGLYSLNANYTWDITRSNGLREPINDETGLPAEARRISQVSRTVWQNYVKGAYDQQPVSRSIAKTL